MAVDCQFSDDNGVFWGCWWRMFRQIWVEYIHDWLCWWRMFWQVWVEYIHNWLCWWRIFGQMWVEYIHLSIWSLRPRVSLSSASRQSANFSFDPCSRSSVKVSVSKQKLHNLGNSSYFDSVLLLFDSLFALAKSIRRYTMGQWDNTQVSPVRRGLHCNILGANKNYDCFCLATVRGGV